MEIRETTRVSRLPAVATLAVGLAAFGSAACRPADFMQELLFDYQRGRHVADLRERAEAGDPEAQRELGSEYLFGPSVPRDPAEAATWYRRAAEQGHLGAQLDVAALYVHGTGVPQDDAEAVKWYRRAAEQGDAYAQTELAILYSEGRGAAQDDASAYTWFSVAALRSVGDVRERAAGRRNTIVYRMTAEQLAEAEARAREWNAAHPRVTPIDPFAVVTSELRESVDIDFSAAARTLLVALQRPCRFCDDSMPFYRRLASRAAGRNDVRIVVVAPPRNHGIGDYLESRGFEPDAVVLAERFPVPGTPSLLAVDAEGSLMHMWAGLLDASQEAEVLDVIFQ